jgi:hypothetical protein
MHYVINSIIPLAAIIWFAANIAADSIDADLFQDTQCTAPQYPTPYQDLSSSNTCFPLGGNAFSGLESNAGCSGGSWAMVTWPGNNCEGSNPQVWVAGNDGKWPCTPVSFGSMQFVCYQD